jgi:hypothetical protein
VISTKERMSGYFSQKRERPELKRLVIRTRTGRVQRGGSCSSSVDTGVLEVDAVPVEEEGLADGLLVEPEPERGAG